MNDLHLRHKNSSRMSQTQRHVPIIAYRELATRRVEEDVVTAQHTPQLGKGGGGADVKALRTALYREFHFYREQAQRTRSTLRLRTLRL